MFDYAPAIALGGNILHASAPSSSYLIPGRFRIGQSPDDEQRTYLETLSYRLFSKPHSLKRDLPHGVTANPLPVNSQRMHVSTAVHDSLRISLDENNPDVKMGIPSNLTAVLIGLQN